MRVRNSDGELAHELTEIDARLGREIAHEPGSVERLLDTRELHRQPVLADLHQDDAVRLLLAGLLLQARDDVVVRGEADDAMGRVGRRAAALGDLGNGAHDRSHGRAAVGLNHDLLACARNGAGGKVVEEEGLRASDRGQLHRDEPHGIRSAHGCTFYKRLGMDGLESLKSQVSSLRSET